MLKHKVKQFLNANVKGHCETVAKAAGHEVVFTPPYHSDVQPIELVWARVKGEVGRQYTKGDTFSAVSN